MEHHRALLAAVVLLLLWPPVDCRRNPLGKAPIAPFRAFSGLRGLRRPRRSPAYGADPSRLRDTDRAPEPDPPPVRIFVFPLRHRISARTRLMRMPRLLPGWVLRATTSPCSRTESTFIVSSFTNMSHLLIRHAQVLVPVWFNEGTAEVYSTTELSGHEIRIGDRSPLTSPPSGPKDARLPRSLSRSSSPRYNEREKTGIFYAESWALVHMLNFSPIPARHAQLPRHALLGEDPARAIQQAFRHIPAAVLGRSGPPMFAATFLRHSLRRAELEGLGKYLPSRSREIDSESGAG